MKELREGTEKQKNVHKSDEEKESGVERDEQLINREQYSVYKSLMGEVIYPAEASKTDGSEVITDSCS